MGGSSPSKQPPNQPGYLQLDLEVGTIDVVVNVGLGVICFLVELVVVLSSRQPNQPGVLHVDVEVDTEVVLVVLL